MAKHDLNVIIFAGRLTDNPEIKYSDNEYAYLRFTVANNRTYKGETKVNWINCVVFGKTAEFLSDYAKKGSTLTVKGDARWEKYTNKEGKEVTAVVVHADEVYLGYSGENNTKTEKDEIKDLEDAQEDTKENPEKEVKKQPKKDAKESIDASSVFESENGEGFPW